MATDVPPDSVLKVVSSAAGFGGVGGEDGPGGAVSGLSPRGSEFP